MRLRHTEDSLKFLSRIVFTALLFGAFPILGKTQDHYPRDRGFDVTKYTFQLEVTDTNDSIFGEANIAVELDAHVSSIFFDLTNVDDQGRGMLAYHVSSKRVRLKYVHEKNLITVKYPEAQTIKTKDTITIRYKGIPSDGLIISKNKHGDRTFFGDNWPNRAHHWIPVVDHPSEKAFIEFSVFHPPHYQVVSNGVLQSVIDISKSRRQTTWASSRELPSKVAVVGVARFAVDYVRQVNGHMVSSWVYPQDAENGFYDYALCADILNYFENKIAPYPFEKLANVQSKTRYGGMENAGCIFYNEGSVNGKRSSEELFAHEIAHQWFGNSASEADWHHVWLSEGFATYLTEVYKQEVKGEESFKSGMEDARKRVLRYYSKFPDGSTIDTSITELTGLLSPMTYQRAAWVLHMLRTRVGDAVFWKAVKAYYSDFQFRNAYSNDLKEIFERASDMDLTEFFEKWLYQPGMIKADIKWTFDEEDKTLMVEVLQPKNAWFPWSAAITIFDQNGMSYNSGILHSDERRFVTSISMESPPKKVVFDAENNLLKW
ncbi:MAG: M1 family metallopeptidase [Flavobacteriales bacterium]|nr:M1 family metallopeptidase [Flavobacteriales bacterium]